MYQSQAIIQNPPQLSVIPQPMAQSYVVKPQVLSTPQTIAAPVVPQMVMAPQVQSVVPAVTSFVPQAPMVTPYILPKGSRMPVITNHQGLIQPMMNFNNIGGSPYGRISMIK